MEEDRYARDSSSRAISSAMKALQDKIRRLETENQKLVSEQAASLTASKQTERELLHKVQELTLKNEQFAAELHRLHDNLTYQQTENQRLQQEQQRLFESHSGEQHSIALQVNELNENIDALQEALNFEKQEKALMKEKLTELNEATAELAMQLEHTLNRMEEDKVQYEESLQQYEKERHSLIAKLAQVEASNTEIKLILASKDKLIAYLQQHKHKKRSKSRHKTPPPSAANDQAEVAKLEAELERQNEKYRALLQLSFSENTDLGGLRQQLDSIATDIEEKSKSLQVMKKRHQQVLRNKLLS